MANNFQKTPVDYSRFATVLSLTAILTEFTEVPVILSASVLTLCDKGCFDEE